ncbi:uncharacterized protein LOC127080673 [Lathyrus oleraceus]|uniref:uncharacterized protein LOC127080673 n=1 Tax=Pisum sativum TaxID=3888 RepID=UPI0021D368E6|nr:uncharacterized protein LOC127080673 [Pisum sativum]
MLEVYAFNDNNNWKSSGRYPNKYYVNQILAVPLRFLISSGGGGGGIDSGSSCSRGGGGGGGGSDSSSSNGSGNNSGDSGGSSGGGSGSSNSGSSSSPTASNKRARESDEMGEEFGQALKGTKSVFKTKNEELDRAVLKIQQLNKTLELTLEMKREAHLISEIHTYELENTIQRYKDALDREKLRIEESGRAC